VSAVSNGSGSSSSVPRVAASGTVSSGRGRRAAKGLGAFSGRAGKGVESGMLVLSAGEFVLIVKVICVVIWDV